MAKRTRITVKILEGNNLLVSDLLTGTSDPMALLWVGSCEEGEVDLKCDKRVQVLMVLYLVALFCGCTYSVSTLYRRWLNNTDCTRVQYASKSGFGLSGKCVAELTLLQCLV